MRQPLVSIGCGYYRSKRNDLYNIIFSHWRYLINMDSDTLRQFDIRVLRYFSVLADELHFGRAAARLNMSQPPLSQQIRQLEDRLGAPLFKRSHHRVELTEAGIMLKSQVSLVFEQLERAIEMTRQTARGLMGSLEIGMISSSLVGVIPHALQVFRERYPDVKWRLHELTPTLQIAGLVDRRIDVCFFRMPREREGLHNEVVMYETLMAALPESHPLAKRTSISLQELSADPFVLFGLGQSRFADFLYQCCLQAGFTPDIRQQVVEVQTLLSLVGANLGVALLPATMKQIAPANVVFRRLDPAMPKVPLYAIYRNDDVSPALGLFLTEVRALVAANPHASRPPKQDEERIRAVFAAKKS